ncbi:MAG: hypothetical protein K0U78_01655 [Actinomycetia bacterium]|nr:hypothetical protein [Actinomycetes bacterium]
MSQIRRSSLAVMSASKRRRNDVCLTAIVDNQHISADFEFAVGTPKQLSAVADRRQLRFQHKLELGR